MKMRLFLITALVMVAFAANSLLNRAALLEPVIGPSGFSGIRVLSGAVVLLTLLWLRDRKRPAPPRMDHVAVLSLTVYFFGFSYAYIAMDAGLGALILFGGAQITMFVGALSEGARPPANRWLGMGISLLGLILLLWPSEAITLNPVSFALMSVAALGWGLYSLAGRKADDPLQATGWNFVYSAPLVILGWLCLGQSEPLQPWGALLAVTSGALTSGIGYALWYSVLPRLGATLAGLTQLSVPVVAVGLGVFLLGETLSLRSMLAGALILSGIAIGILRKRTR